MVVGFSMRCARGVWEQVLVGILLAQAAFAVSPMHDWACVSAFQAAENIFKSCKNPNLGCCKLASKFLISDGRPTACLCRLHHSSNLNTLMKQGDIKRWPITCGVFLAQYKTLCSLLSSDEDILDNLQRATQAHMNGLKGFSSLEQYKLHGRPQSPITGLSDEQCDDQPTDNGVSCEKQKALGKCSEKWMTDGGYCRRTCGSDGCSTDIFLHENLNVILHSSQSDADGCEECDDLPPDSTHTCKQQKLWGKCSSSFMIDGGFCRRTCGCAPCTVKDIQRSVASGTTSTKGTAHLASVVPPAGNQGTIQRFVLTAPKSIASVSHLTPMAPTILNSPAVPPAGGDCTTILEGIIGSSDLQILGVVVQASRLGPLMANPLMVATAFLPIDSAIIRLIAKLGITRQQFLADTQLLQQVVRQHIVPDLAISARDLVGLESKIQTLAGDTLKPEIVNNRITISTRSTSGILVAGDLQACGSLVHIIDSVLIT